MKAHGDERMSPVVERDEAAAIKPSDLIPSEAVTVVLSKAGWIRMAKGHDIDATTLSYRSGDEYQASAQGKSNEKLILLDSTGRSYALDTVHLPSARGQGEPITSMLNPPAGAKIEQILFGHKEQNVLLASALGYGFVGQFANFETNQKSGKAIINLGESTLLPAIATNPDDTLVAALTNAGYLLVFELSDLPSLAKGKGNKIIGLKDKDDETLISLVSLKPSDSLVITAGKRTLTIKPADFENYMGKRASRGGRLPKGYWNVSGMTRSTPA